VGAYSNTPNNKIASVGTAFRLSASLNTKEGQKLKTISTKIAYLILDMNSTAFCRFMAEIWFLLFFLASNSESPKLLITANAVRGVLSLRAADTATCVTCAVRGVLSLRAADTNQIQREFLFNNCIQSQNISSASKYSRQKTNFLKPFHLFQRTWRSCCLGGSLLLRNC
jgi:hypothetical protein